MRKIDFARKFAGPFGPVTDQRSRTGFKGTLPYMSPEQFELNPPTAVSDVFPLAFVCYEALTRRRPFTGNNEDEIRQSILHFTPPPASELNPAVSLALSQVIHAAMQSSRVIERQRLAHFPRSRFTDNLYQRHSRKGTRSEFSCVLQQR